MSVKYKCLYGVNADLTRRIMQLITPSEIIQNINNNIIMIKTHLYLKYHMYLQACRTLQFAGIIVTLTQVSPTFFFGGPHEQILITSRATTCYVRPKPMS